MARLSIVVIAAIGWAWHLRWIADDAFIAFRCARHWADGHGLVFNVGERVEGYTNFLWTALIALGMRVGIAAPPWLVVGSALRSNSCR